MSERNPYSNYNYDNYDRDPRIHDEETLRERIMGRITNPLFATIALLLTGAAFAGIIVASYPGARSGVDVPVIQADAQDPRSAPEDTTQMAGEDSTVYSNIRDNEMAEKPPVEDMLSEEKPMDKLETFARDAFKSEDKDDAPAEAASESPSEITEQVADVPQPQPVSEPAEQAAAPVAEKTIAQNAGQPAKVFSIAQQEEKIPPRDGASAAVQTTAESAAVKASSSSPVPAAKIKPAGSSPETLAFVRSVLNEKDQKATQPAASAAAAKIEPAAGAATQVVSPAIKSGNYFAQLGSVKDESGAAAEWKRMQKTFASLAGLQYRVQRADLGAKGVFYRIQAGPMSKDNAATVCDAIKAQKPGGCIIVQ